MTKNIVLRVLFAGLFALGLAINLHAQLVTAGATGSVHDNSGKGIAGATVTAVHVPTGTTYTATTNDSGRYNFRSMIAGGPYTFTAKASGYKISERQDVETQLGSEVDVS